MRRKLLFYGDSNTYGYDPAAFPDDRYPVEKTWPHLLGVRLGESWEVLPRGLNGRKLPSGREDLERILKMAGLLGEKDVFGIMLGTNDLGMLSHPDAALPAGRMETLLQALTGDSRSAGSGHPLSPAQILVVAPPWIGGCGEAMPELKPYQDQSRLMNARFAQIAAGFGTAFADAGEWQISMAFDQIHLSLAGHRQFAAHMEEAMNAFRYV